LNPPTRIIRPRYIYCHKREDGKPTPLLKDYTGYCIERFVSEFPSVGLYICPGESLELEQTPGWINDVIFAAVKRAGGRSSR